MKPHFLSISLFSLASAFSTTSRYLSLPSSPSFKTAIDSNTVLSAEKPASVSASEKKKPLSPKELLDQQRAKEGLPDLESHPKIYSDELLDDMKEILLLLEKRTNGGQGSVSVAEVDKFVTMSNNILVEMKQKEYERLEDATSSSTRLSPTPSSSDSDISSTTATTVSESSANTPTATDVDEESVYHETEEGPAYSATGGQGSIPKDTTNTYIIPGMDEMSPVEYRAALQQSIKDRQTKRHSTGSYGNRNTWDYLNNLSGDKGVLKPDVLED